MARVLVPLAEGFEDMEAVTLVDLCRRGGLEVVTAGLEPGPVKGGRGTVVLPDAALDEVLGQDFDAVALPGGPGTPRLRADARVLDLVRRQHASGRLTAAICAAPTVLAEAGLLKGRRATAYPGSLSDNPPEGLILAAGPVVEDGNLLTSTGPGTAVDFGLAVVERLAGRKTREEVEERLVRRG